MNARVKRIIAAGSYTDLVSTRAGDIMQLKDGQRLAVPGGHLEVLAIDPAFAAELMKHKHPNQRGVRARHVEALARDMGDGRWRSTMDPLRLDEELRVIDGQHRLLAIIKSGTTQKFLVAILNDPEAFYAIDQGIVRSLNDIRTTLGKKVISRTISGAILLEHRGFSASRQQKLLSKEDTDRVLDAFPFMDEVVELYRVGKKAKIYGVGSMAAAIAAMRVNKPEAMKFFSSVFSLTSLIDGVESPQAYVLYLFLQSSRQEGAGRTTGEHYILEAAYKSLRAWNAYRKNEVLHRLQYSPGEKMPKALR